MAEYAKVIVDISQEKLDKTFEYRIPPYLTQRIAVGMQVYIPFGSRRITGYVVELSDEAEYDEDKLKNIAGIVTDSVPIESHLIALAGWMREHYGGTMNQALKMVLPIKEKKKAVEHKRVRLALHPVEAKNQLGAYERRHSTARAKLLRALLEEEELDWDLVTHKIGVSGSVIRAMEESGVVKVIRETQYRNPVSHLTSRGYGLTLNDEQQEAVEAVWSDYEKGIRSTYLINGVTGSGKTEVFIRLVRQTLVQGKSAMILVPEIALTPQMVMWFRARFGAVAAVLHSRLSAGERFDEWRRIRRGDARVVIGARSAVFAPCGNLGLIVVDEEHESPYISDRHPRYDAREVAIRRCENEHATLLLASATPSILSFARARRGDYVLLEMPSRVGNRPMPQVTLVDMRKEMENGNRSVFSGQLVAALKNCVARGEQAMLLMNRRGYNSFVSCRSCGYVVKCPNCDVAMTYHVVGSGQTEAKLHCHYCGFAALPPNTCPKCGSKYIRYFGAGTQKIEEELKKLFPQENVIRMDIDTTSGKDGHAKLLDEFRSGRAKLLVGTQMIAKGLDFPKVTLVGVIAADMTLNLPDYRARERTFQLLTQVAGRAGRGTLPGQVIIQTYKPEDEVIQTAAAQDYRAFFELEFDRRRTGLYPPFTILARLLVESNSPQKAREVATMLHARCEELLNAHPQWKKRALMVRLDQPSITVLRGKTRWHVLMKLLVHPETEQFAAALSELAREKQEGAEVYFEYNPTTMM